MAQKWQDAPEVVQQPSLPEVYYPAPALAAPYRGRNFASAPLKPYASFNDPVAYPTIDSHDAQSTHGILPLDEQPRKSLRRFCRCPPLVFGLSAIIIILTAVVIGLAAGTSIQTHRASDAESKLTALLSNVSSVDRGCSANPGSVTATHYTSDFFYRSTFTIYCNTDAPNPPLQSFFVGNFDDCIDACASYTAYAHGNFPRVLNTANFTCAAVSFVPAWTNRTEAFATNAPGNCYLKPGPQNPTALTHPSGDGAAVHAAVLQDLS